MELRKCSLVCRCSWMHRILAEPASGCTKKSSSTSGNCQYLILSLPVIAASAIDAERRPQVQGSFRQSIDPCDQPRFGISNNRH